MHLGPRTPQDHIPPRRGGGGVQVDDGAGEALNGGDGPIDQIVAGCGEDGDGHVLGYRAAVGQVAYEVEVGLARRRIADLDLLEPHRDQEIEHLALASSVHRLGQSLVSVAQVDRNPQGRLLEAA